MEKATRVGIALIAIGLIVPHIIDAIETANHLDIRRDFGVLPWLIMAIVGACILLRQFIQFLRKKKDARKDGEGDT